MQLAKPHIDLIQQIRHQYEGDTRRSIKFADHDVIDKILLLYPQATNPELLALIESLCTLAGEPWVSTLADLKNNHSHAHHSPQPKKQSERVYQGIKYYVDAKTEGK